MLEEQKQPTTPASNTKWIALAIGGGCALLACLGLVVALVIHFLLPTVEARLQSPAFGSSSPVPPTQLATPAVAVLPQQDANTLGDPNAPVKIIEYADFQCPYCLRYWRETEPKIIAAYVKTGKVFYEYHSVGAFLGPESGSAAEAAYCAGDQGKFWEYHDTLFSNWTGENVGDFSNDKLDKYAQSVGLDQSAFDGCLSSHKYARRVEQDVSDAQAAGIHATPSFLVNGKLIEGAQPFNVFQGAIEAALQGQ